MEKWKWSVLISFCFYIVWLITGTEALRDVNLIVPTAVQVGDTVPLGCRWTLDTGETLYSVKWYRGRQEFFRYIPKELPHYRLFAQQGINVDLVKSGPQQVVVRNTNRSLAGRIRCEVSADAPSFHTEVRSSYIHVVELPESAPIIRAEKGWYAPGDVLRAYCHAPPADPPANLTWLLNGKEIHGKQLLHEIIYPSSADVPDATTAPTTPFDDANNVIFSPWKALAGFVSTTRDNIIHATQAEDHVTTTSSHDDSTTEVYIPSTTEASKRLPSSSQLSFIVTPDSFEKGRLRLSCVSKVHGIYTATAELLIEEERPQIASVLGTRDASSGPLTSSLFTIVLVILAVIQQKNWLYLR